MHKFSKSLPVTCIVSDAKTRETMIHAIHGKHLYVTSYDYMRRDIELYDSIEFEYVILDESQYIKNQKTKNAISVKQMTFPNKRKYAWIQAFLVVGGSGNACSRRMILNIYNRFIMDFIS